MNIVIIGAGAIGLLLHKQIKDNLPLNNKLQIASNKQPTPSQYQFENLDGLLTNIPLTAANRESISQADIIIICVKAFQVVNVIEQHCENLNKSASIVLSHNGMGVYEALPDSLKIQHPIYALLTTNGSKKNADWSVTHTGIGHYDFGLLNNGVLIDHNAHAAFLKAVIPNINYHEDIKEKQWQKLAINSVINPITALNNIKNGDVLKPEFSTLKKQLIDEFVRIAESEGVHFDADSLEYSINQVASNTAENTSSMLSDVISKRKTEIEFINGYLGLIANKHNKNRLAKTHCELVERINNLI